MMKRQRLNSAVTKSEFKFMPSFKPSNEAPKMFSTNFEPSVSTNKTRNIKASQKLNNSLNRLSEKQNTMVKRVNIKVPDLSDPTKLHHPEPMQQQNN